MPRRERWPPARERRAVAGEGRQTFTPHRSDRDHVSRNRDPTVARALDDGDHPDDGDVPSIRPTRTDVDCGEVRPVVVADGVELPTRVDEACPCVQRDRGDSAADARVPESCRAELCVDGRETTARLATDGGELAGDVDRRSGRGDLDRAHLAVAIRVPGTNSSLLGVDCAQSGSVGPVHLVEVTAKVEDPTVRGQREDRDRGGFLLVALLVARVERVRLERQELPVPAERYKGSSSRPVDAIEVATDESRSRRGSPSMHRPPPRRPLSSRRLGAPNRGRLRT